MPSIAAECLPAPPPIAVAVYRPPSLAELLERYRCENLAASPKATLEEYTGAVNQLSRFLNFPANVAHLAKEGLTAARIAKRLRVPELLVAEQLARHAAGEPTPRRELTVADLTRDNLIA